MLNMIVNPSNTEGFVGGGGGIFVIYLDIPYNRGMKRSIFIIDTNKK